MRRSATDLQLRAAELLGALAASDRSTPREVVARWREAGAPFLQTNELTDTGAHKTFLAFERAYRATMRGRQRRPEYETVEGVRLPVAPSEQWNDRTTVDAGVVVYRPRMTRRAVSPPRNRLTVWGRVRRFLLWAFPLIMLGCGGSLEMPSPDAGPPPAMSGCYPDASLGCGGIVGRWCWSSPSDITPGPTCVSFHPEGGVTPTGYWCCP